MSRRDFLRKGTLATATAALPWYLDHLIPTFALAPPLPATPGTRVIVVGAGLAGLAATFELVKAGHDVTILEARNRAGGRVYTLRSPFADGLHAEAGAMFAGGPYLAHYADLVGVEIFQPEPENRALLYHLKARRLGAEPGKPVDWPLELAPAEREAGLRGLWPRYVEPVIPELGNPLAGGWPPPSLRQYDEMSYAAFLRSRGASAGAVALMTLGTANLFGDGAETVSALHFLRDRAGFPHEADAWRAAWGSDPPPPRSGVIRGGSDSLPRAFAARLADRIYYGSPVVRIEQDDARVRASFRQAGQHHTLEADYLVCTIPFTVLRRLEVSPPFSPEKRRAINELQYSSISRIYLQCRRRYWEDDGWSGAAFADLPVPRVLVHPLGTRTTRGIIEAHMGGSQARTVAGLSEEEQVEFALEQMDRLFPGIRDHFEAGVSHSWVNDPWTLGGYSSLAPGQASALLPHVARPEGRVHFAGEHTSVLSVSMNSALESGYRAAREVAARAAPAG